MNSLKQSILKSAIGLGIFAIVTAGFIAVTETLTSKKIAHEVNLYRAKAMLEVVPSSLRTRNILDNAISLPPSQILGIDSDTKGYVVFNNEQPAEIIFPIVAHNGYSGDIKLIVGINRSGILEGARVTEHHETPGLGDRVETRKSNWIHQFDGKSLLNPGEKNWKVVKDGGDFDQLTGATITPRAIVGGVKIALEYYKKNKVNIWKAAAQLSAKAKESFK
jgi:electron transport complex protein RnfG